MSEQQVERLQALLTKVQHNRQTARSSGSRSDVSAADQARARMTESGEAVTAALPAPPQAAESASISPKRPPARATSLEKALNAELDREEPAVSAPPPLAAARREAPATAQRPDRPAAEPPAGPQPIVPRLIDPDPPRASARPIAQLVSKHAPAVDATFGAMLKRSLSLRPH